MIDATPAQPFDAVAATYDASFSRSRLGRWLRALVQEQLGALFTPGAHVIELGCGTGEDALWLARRGVRVTATDASPGMLAVARAKVQAAGLAAAISLQQLDINELAHPERLSPANWPGAPLDGAFANFGPLNCLAERRRFAEGLARLVRPGGRVGLVMLGPLCPWELGWHLAHGQPRAALRRLRGGQVASVGAGGSLRVWYPSPRRLRAEFAPHFRHLATRAVGVLLPPSYLSPLVERWPQHCLSLALLERRLASRLPWRWLGDHYLSSFERCADAHP